MAPKTLNVALRSYFGVRPGDSLKDFLAEVRQLSDRDRKDLREELEKEGIPIKD